MHDCSSSLFEITKFWVFEMTFFEICFTLSSFSINYKTMAGNTVKPISNNVRQNWPRFLITKQTSMYWFISIIRKLGHSCEVLKKTGGAFSTRSCTFWYQKFTNKAQNWSPCMLVYHICCGWLGKKSFAE